MRRVYRLWTLETEYQQLQNAFHLRPAISRSSDSDLTKHKTTKGFMYAFNILVSGTFLRISPCVKSFYLYLPRSPKQCCKSRQEDLPSSSSHPSMIIFRTSLLFSLFVIRSSTNTVSRLSFKHTYTYLKQFVRNIKGMQGTGGVARLVDAELPADHKRQREMVK